MKVPRLLNRFKLAGAAALVGTLLLSSTGFAQTSYGNEPFLVRVDSPANGSAVAGNVTLTGVALDLATGQPATRVAVYDGNTYIADVSMDTMRNLGTIYPGGVGWAPIGWTLIYDSRQLADGMHQLTFAAQFPDGATATTAYNLAIANTSPAWGLGYGPAPYNGGYWPNGPWADPAYGPGYWVNGTYYNPQTGQACTEGSCTFTTSGN
jgi:hypothetical protein